MVQEEEGEGGAQQRQQEEAARLHTRTFVVFIVRVVAKIRRGREEGQKGLLARQRPQALSAGQTGRGAGGDSSDYVLMRGERQEEGGEGNRAL